MKVMVTGATGFVGGHLVDRLLERGDQVTALVRSPERARPLAQRGVQLVTGDLANVDAIHAAANGQQVVYHLAAKLGASSEAELMLANRDGTSQVVDACSAQSAPPRVVLISSMAAGGPARHGNPRTASGINNPVTMYGRSKLAAEQVVSKSTIPWTIIRPPVVYGPRDREAFLPLFKAVSFGIAPTFGDGSMELSLVHVRDLVDALVIAGDSPTVLGHVFYVNHPEVTSSANLIRAIAREMDRSPLPVQIPQWATRVALTVAGAWADVRGEPSILHVDKIHEFYQDAWTADPSAFIAATGWQPQWNLERGLADTAAWYRKEHWI